MTEPRDKIICACHDDSFLNTIYKISLKDKSENILGELILLNLSI